MNKLSFQVGSRYERTQHHNWLHRVFQRSRWVLVSPQTKPATVNARPAEPCFGRLPSLARRKYVGP